MSDTKPSKPNPPISRVVKHSSPKASPPRSTGIIKARKKNKKK